MFATLGLHHWSMETKLIITMFTVFFPICFVIVGGLCFLAVCIYNKACEYFYEQKINKLEKKERSLIEQIDNLKKKSN